MTKPVDLTRYGLEVEAGLPNERAVLDAAMERRDFYNYDGRRWESRFRRDAESSFDYQGRPHRPSGLLRSCVDALSEHLYCPGPARSWGEPAGDEFLRRVAGDNLLDALLHRADQLAALNGPVAIQIDAGAGDFTRKPITYRLWAREQFAVWTAADDSLEVVAVATIDRHDLRTRYRLWSDAEVWTYRTKRADETFGGRVALLESKEAHGYGALPFAFVHDQAPLESFGGACVGEYLHQAELRVDNRLNFLDESILKHLNPVPVAEGVPSGWKPVLEPQRFLRMPLSAPRIGASGGYEPGEFARLYYLSPQVDVAGAWADLSNYLNLVFRNAGVPFTASLIDQAPGVVSGIALLLAEAPLLKRARARQRAFGVYELELARKTLLCAGNHYGLPALVAAAEAGTQTLAWPQPSIPAPTPDALELLQAEVAAGLKSHVMAVQQWYGVDRSRAIEILNQIKADGQDLAAIFPGAPRDEPAPGPGADPGPAGDGAPLPDGNTNDEAEWGSGV